MGLGYNTTGIVNNSDAEVEVQHLYRMRDKGILTVDEFASAMEKIQKRRSGSGSGSRSGTPTSSPTKGSHSGVNTPPSQVRIASLQCNIITLSPHSSQ